MDSTQFGSVDDRTAQGAHCGELQAPDQARVRRSRCTADRRIACRRSIRRSSLSEGGIPLVDGGKIIGAIGCSGATGPQDGVACKAGVDTIK